jgi:hypothetical protein
MRPEDHLTLDAARADFVIDVANIVREPTLGGTRGADLGRLLALLDGLADFAADDGFRAYAVTDGSLLTDGRLTADERATLARWYEDGLLEVLPVADDRIVELAGTADVRAVTRDNLLDYYRRHPWLPGNRDRVLWPEAGPGGTVRVETRIMPTPAEWQLSAKEEESALLGARMIDRRGGTGPRADLLLRRWRCPESGCPQFGGSATGSSGAPTYRRGTVLCPAHDVPLTDLGPRPREAQLKIRVDGRVRHRFLVADGGETVVGRAPDGGGDGDDGVALAPWLNAAARAAVSRRHVVIRLRGTTLAVRDVSANGTRIRIPGRDDVRLRAGAEWRLGRSHAVVLHDTVTLEPSGRNFVFDTDADTQADADAEAGAAAAADAAAREARQPTMLAGPPAPAPSSAQGRNRRQGGRKKRRPRR